MQKIKDTDVTSDCLVTNTGCLGIYKMPVAVVYPEGTAFPLIHAKPGQGSLDSYYGQDFIVR